MSAVAAWLLCGAGVWLLAGGGSTLRGRIGGAADAPRRASELLRSPIAQQVVAGLAAAIGCVAALGVTSGGAVAVVLGPAAAWGAAWLQRRASGAPPDPGLPLTLDLVAAALRGGQPLASALALAAPSCGAAASGRLLRVAGLLRLGADADEAWRVVAEDPLLAPVAVAARRSATSGVRVARAFEQLADEVRAAQRVTAQSRAHRVGVYAIAPLGLCFLPAFVCLGIVPVVVDVATSLLPGLSNPP
jgi:Flp pilus assembly protein TadB